MSFTETLQSITGKLLADCTDQELYLALLELVRQKSADRVQPVTGRKLYYISAEFLIGKLLSNNLTAPVHALPPPAGHRCPPPQTAFSLPCRIPLCLLVGHPMQEKYLL